MIEVRDGAFWFNGEPQNQVIGRSSFKLANVITYHYVGRGGGKYSLGYARRWVDYNQAIFGKNVVLRVLLETEGWNPCDDENGTPENCMFGSEPRDQGFWQRDRLRDGARETEVHPVGKRVLEWFFATSATTGCAFELVIDATLKHDDIPKGEIDHVIRQVGIEMGRLQQRFPTALIIPNMRNEWNAHNQSGHTLADVNMWAVRWDRDNYTPGWRAPIIVDPGGGNEFTYDVGPEPGKYRAGMIHPDRGGGWEQFPNQQQLRKLKNDARGMPIGSTESMYYVEINTPEDQRRRDTWYRRGGVNTNWDMQRQHYENLLAAFDYVIFHDEKGVQCDKEWPIAETRFERWAREKFGIPNPDPDPDPDPDPVPDPTPGPVGFFQNHGQNFDFLRWEHPVVLDVDQIGNAPIQFRHRMELPEPRRIVAVRSFFGHDRGDAYEMMVTAYADTEDRPNPRFYLWDRIDEATAPTDDERRLEVLASPVVARFVQFDFLLRVTGKNELVEREHPSHDKWRAVFDFNVHLLR